MSYLTDAQYEGHPLDEHERDLLAQDFREQMVDDADWHHTKAASYAALPHPLIGGEA